MNADFSSTRFSVRHFELIKLLLDPYPFIPFRVLELPVKLISLCTTAAFISATSLCSWELAISSCDTAVISWFNTCSVFPHLLASFSCWMTSYVDCDDVSWMTVRTHRLSCSSINDISALGSVSPNKKNTTVNELAKPISVFSSTRICSFKFVFCSKEGLSECCRVLDFYLG